MTIPLNGTVVVGDEKSLHGLWWRQQGRKFQNTLFLQYETVQSLTLFHFMFLVSRGARRIVLLQKEDQEYQLSATAKQQDLANEILTKLYDIEDAVTSCRLADFDSLLAVSRCGSIGSIGSIGTDKQR